ncbi:14-3-3-like protein [Abortiporus biennis]|nr:14-3-3-like protein [Abortiporus biennis]
MSSVKKINVSSRLDNLLLARVADSAERYQDVISQIKTLVTNGENGQLTAEERNLLSIAYKNLTGTLRSSWRTIDTLEKKDGHSTRHVYLMQVEKERIREELDKVCKDVVELMEKHLIPAANTGEETVFYSKMMGDYYRYLAEFTKNKAGGGAKDQNYATSSLDAYKSAYKHALSYLDPTHPTRLGLALNFAVYYHDIQDSPERACFLAKHAFDEAINFALEKQASAQSMEDSLMILQLLKDDMILWSGEIQ